MSGALALDTGTPGGSLFGTQLFSSYSTVATCVYEPVEETWRRSVEARFERLSRLPAGWDGYGGVAPKQSVIAYARSVLNSVMRPESPAPSIVPMTGGGIQLEWHINEFDVEVAIFSSNEVELSVEFPDDREPIEDQPVSISLFHLSEVLEELA